MKIGINSLVIDKRKAGVGNYAFNLINAFDKIVKDYLDMDIYVQKGIFGFNYKSSLVNYINVKNFSSSYERIIYEQLFMPIKYKRGGYDLIHLLDYQSPFFCMGQKYIITIHDLSFFLYDNIFTIGQSFFKKFNTSIGVKKSKAIITISKSTKNEIMKIFPGINDQKIEVIPLAVDNTLFEVEVTKQKMDLVKRKYEINSEYILFVGTLEPRKNLLTLIKSFKRVLYYNDNIKLVVVGKKGWLYEEILKNVEDEKLTGKVLFTGYVPEEDLPALYKGAEVFVFPSLYEGFGIPPLEAMTVGCPVITSNVSSLPEVVDDAAVLINPYDEIEIANYILMILNDANKRNELIIKGKKRSNKFSWDKTAQKTLEVYEKIGRELK